MAESRGNSEDVSIILPTLNEGNNISPMVEVLIKTYPAAKIIIVDDNSTDSTVEMARRHIDASGRVKVIVRKNLERGLTASIIEGILNVETKYFVVMDADFQHPPEAVGRIIASLRSGNELVIGIREDKLSMQLRRQFASWAANALAKSYLVLKRRPRSNDTMSGFFGGETNLVQAVVRENEVKFEKKGFKALFDILKFSPRNTKIDEVMFKFDERRSGESKLSSKIVLSIMRQCGPVGKLMATGSEFFFITALGRFMATIVLGLLSTLTVILFTGKLAGDVAINTLLASVVGIIFIIMSNEIISKKWPRDSLRNGLLIVTFSLVGYMMTITLAYILNDGLQGITVLASLLGFIVAFSYNALGTHLWHPLPSH